MGEKYYTLLSEVARISKENYMRYQKRSDFAQVLKQIIAAGHGTSIPSRFRRVNRFLSPEEFRDYAYTSVVAINPILENRNPFHIEETNLFPQERDVFTLIHLPYNESPIHEHDYFEINYVYRGSCTQVFADEQKDFHQGDLILIAPHSPHSVLTYEESLIVSICIRQSTFNQTFFQLLNANDILSTFFKHSLYGKDTRNYMSFSIQEYHRYESMIQQIFSESNAVDEYCNIVCISLINIFFAQLLRQFGNTVKLWNTNCSATFNRDFPMIMKFVQHNYNTVSLSVLSQIFHYSEVHLSRMFKQNFNRNFSAILQDLKLSHAKNYLETTNDTIEEIAQHVGYDSPDYLARAFKRRYQLPPSDYRKRFYEQRHESI